MKSNMKDFGVKILEYIYIVILGFCIFQWATDEQVFWVYFSFLMFAIYMGSTAKRDEDKKIEKLREEFQIELNELEERLREES